MHFPGLTDVFAFASPEVTRKRSGRGKSAVSIARRSTCDTLAPYSKLISTWSSTLNLLLLTRLQLFLLKELFQHSYHTGKRFVMDSTQSFKVFWLELLVSRVGHGFGLDEPTIFTTALTYAISLI